MRPSFRRNHWRRGISKSLQARRGPCRCLQRTRKRYARTRQLHSLLISRKSGSSSETYFSVASRTTHARETFFFLAILSRETYVSEGKVTDNRQEEESFSSVGRA